MNHAWPACVSPGFAGGKRPKALPLYGLAGIVVALVSCSPETGQPPPAPPPQVTAAAAVKAAAPTSPWAPLAADGLHDASNPALGLLQQPAEALSELPPAQDGNQVDWVAALRQQLIVPRTNIYPETEIKVLDLDILMEETAGMAMVRFPHRAHTEWLDCENCHDGIFKAKRGANPVNMFSILQGEYCGQCHGAVAFPLTQCHRCHSVPRVTPPAPNGG